MKRSKPATVLTFTNFDALTSKSLFTIWRDMEDQDQLFLFILKYYNVDTRLWLSAHTYRGVCFRCKCHECDRDRISFNDDKVRDLYDQHDFLYLISVKPGFALNKGFKSSQPDRHYCQIYQASQWVSHYIMIK